MGNGVLYLEPGLEHWHNQYLLVGCTLRESHFRVLDPLIANGRAIVEIWEESIAR